MDSTVFWSSNVTVNNYSPSISEALKFSFRNITEIMALPVKKMAISGIDIKTHYAISLEEAKRFMCFVWLAVSWTEMPSSCGGCRHMEPGLIHRGPRMMCRDSAWYIGRDWWKISQWLKEGRKEMRKRDGKRERKKIKRKTGLRYRKRWKIRKRYKGRKEKGKDLCAPNWSSVTPSIYSFPSHFNDSSISRKIRVWILPSSPLPPTHPRRLLALSLLCHVHVLFFPSLVPAPAQTATSMASG